MCRRRGIGGSSRQPEKVVQAHIVQLLRSLGTVYVLGTRRRSGDYQGTMQTPGVPDVLAFLRGAGTLPPVQLWVECKAAGGRLRAEQAAFRASCLAAGIPHVVGDLDAVIAWLLRHGHLSDGQVPHYRLPAAVESGAR